MLYSSFKMVLKMLSKQKQMEVRPILTMAKLRKSVRKFSMQLRIKVASLGIFKFTKAERGLYVRVRN